MHHLHSDEEIWRKIEKLMKRRAVYRHRGNEFMVMATTAKIHKLLEMVSEKAVFT
jgi:hypothetical protein